MTELPALVDNALVTGSSDLADAIQAIADLANMAAEPTDVQVDTIRAKTWIVPNGHRLAVLEALPSLPPRRTGTTTVRDLPSFLSFFGKHAGAAAEIHADPATMTVTAVLDAAGYGDTSYGDDRLVLTLALSKRLRRWQSIDGKLLEQEPFAEFIEDNGPDIVEPSSADMLSIASTLIAKRGLEFESGVSLKNGRRIFQYRETIGAHAGEKGDIEIPDKIVLGIPVWEGAQGYRVSTRFRYRIGNSLRMGIKIDGLDQILEDAFDEIVTTIAKALSGAQLILLGPAPAATTPQTQLRIS